MQELIDLKGIRYVVGLGNPGSQYSKSLHNLGFIFIDRLIKHFPSCVKLNLHKQDAWSVGNLTMSKPQTYMNLSGEAISELRRRNPQPNSDFVRSILVIHDDVTLDMYKIKYKQGRIHGGSGGHNGIRSICSTLMRMGLSSEESTHFDRIRLGCNDHMRSLMSLDKYVLLPMTEEFLSKWYDVIDDYIDSMSWGI